MPRFLVMVKTVDGACAGGEDNRPAHTTEMLTEMTAFNEQLVAAGVLLGGEGLQPSSRDGYRVRFSSSTEPEVRKGPFEPDNLVSGWWVWKTEDVEEALGWAKKIPFRAGEVEVRRVSEVEDFGDAMTEELVEKEKKMLAEIEKQQA